MAARGQGRRRQAKAVIALVFLRPRSSPDGCSDVHDLRVSLQVPIWGSEASQQTTRRPGLCIHVRRIATRPDTHVLASSPHFHIFLQVHFPDTSASPSVGKSFPAMRHGRIKGCTGNSRQNPEDTVAEPTWNTWKHC